MITAGVDVGAKTCKIVILKDGRIIGREKVLAGYDAKETIAQAWDKVLEAAGIKKDDINNIVATGSGSKEVASASRTVTEVTAASKGAIKINPEVRTVIDVGAEEGRAIKIDENGNVVDFAINEKCAAGAGAFTEAMARALEVKLEQLGPLSLRSTQAVPMNAQCAVFAESELVTLVHAQTPKPDMARAVHDAIADRIVSMVRRVGVAQKIMLIGGVAHNVGFVESLKRELESDVIIPDEPEFVSAYGVALAASAK
ncbi:MAG: CoA activase [Proteobacteria bacterium]|nr:CoA activase [Pseudomonadota bacterium]MBU1742542.1 CoA activase [Pseudomonadota bacterium]